MNTLKIHIGHYKTGTTALQVFCSRHRDQLLAQGVDYPTLRHHNAKHSGYAFGLYRSAGVEKLMHGFAEPTPPEEMWGTLFEYVRDNPVPVTAISSEEFMRVGAFPAAADHLRRIVETLGQGIKFEIIVYLRSPQGHLKSWFNQLIKMGQKVSDFNSALAQDVEVIHYDYAAALRPWAEIFGAENVSIRRYPERFDAPDALITDFMEALGVRVPEDAILPEGDPNPRLDDRMIDAVRLMQNMGFPRPVVNNVRDQAMTYLQHQDRLGRAGIAALETARGQAEAGLAALPSLGQASFDLADLSEGLPEADSPETVAQTQMMGFVLSEVIALRRRVNRYKLPELIERIDRIEAQLGLTPPPTEHDDENPVL